MSPIDRLAAHADTTPASDGQPARPDASAFASPARSEEGAGARPQARQGAQTAGRVTGARGRTHAPHPLSQSQFLPPRGTDAKTARPGKTTRRPRPDAQHTSLLSASLWLGDAPERIAELDEALQTLFEDFQDLRQGRASGVFDNGPNVNIRVRRADGTLTVLDIPPQAHEQPMVYAVSLLGQCPQKLTTGQRAALLQAVGALRQIWAHAQGLAGLASNMRALPHDEATQLVEHVCRSPRLENESWEDWPRAHALLPLARQVGDVLSLQRPILKAVLELKNLHARAEGLAALGGSLQVLAPQTRTGILRAALDIPDPQARSVALRGLGRHAQSLTAAEHQTLLQAALALPDDTACGRALEGLGAGSAAFSDTARARMIQAALHLDDDHARARALAGLGEGLHGFTQAQRGIIVRAVLDFPDPVVRPMIMEKLACATASLRPEEVTKVYAAILQGRGFDRLRAGRRNIAGLLPMVTAPLDNERLDRITEAVMGLDNSHGRAAALVSMMSWPSDLGPQQRIRMVYLLCNLRDEAARAAGAVGMLKLPAFYSTQQHEDLLDVVLGLRDENVRNQAIMDLLRGRSQPSSSLKARLTDAVRTPPDEQGWSFALRQLCDAPASLPVASRLRLLDRALTHTRDPQVVREWVETFSPELLQGQSHAHWVLGRALLKLRDTQIVGPLAARLRQTHQTLNQHLKQRISASGTATNGQDGDGQDVVEHGMSKVLNALTVWEWRLRHGEFEAQIMRHLHHDQPDSLHGEVMLGVLTLMARGIVSSSDTHAKGTPEELHRRTQAQAALDELAAAMGADMPDIEPFLPTRPDQVTKNSVIPHR